MQRAGHQALIGVPHIRQDKRRVSNIQSYTQYENVTLIMTGWSRNVYGVTDRPWDTEMKQ